MILKAKSILNIAFFLLIIAAPFAAFSSEIATRYNELTKLNYIFLMDRDTGEVLLEKNADERISPSSMTKLMTAYVAFREIKKGNIALSNQCLIGKDAWRKRGSTMFLNHGDVVSIEDLITGLIVVSGNDSAVALAQSISGSVKSFADLMNDTARDIGLKNSNFRNPHGLNQEGHYMSLRDLGILTRRIAKDFPEFMHFFSVKEFSYSNIKQRNRNPLIKNNYIGATGMKTGYTSDGGYGVVGTATRGNRSLIGVTNNTLTPSQRSRAIIQLLDFGFDNYDKIIFFNKNEPVIKANVWLGKKENVELVSKENVAINILNTQSVDDIEFEVRYKDPVFTPIKKGQEIGKLIIKDAQRIILKTPLFAKEDVEKAGYFTRMWRVFTYKTKNVVED